MPAFPSSPSRTTVAPSVLAPLVVSGLSVTYPDRTVLSGVDLLAPHVALREAQRVINGEADRSAP